MGRRYIIKKKSRRYYVERRRDGTIKRWTRKGKSLTADRRVKAKHTPKRSGYGHKGDYKKRKRRTTRSTKYPSWW